MMFKKLIEHVLSILFVVFGENNETSFIALLQYFENFVKIVVYEEYKETNKNF